MTQELQVTCAFPELSAGSQARYHLPSKLAQILMSRKLNQAQTVYNLYLYVKIGVSTTVIGDLVNIVRGAWRATPITLQWTDTDF